MSRFLFGMIFGAATLYAALHYHVVRGDQGVFLVPKSETSLSAIYTDVREFTIGDWRDHRELAFAISKSNRTQLIDGTSSDAIGNTLDSVVDGLLADR